MEKIETATLNIATLIRSVDAVSSEDGEVVFSRIEAELDKGRFVILDFEGINLLITTFLNAAIGQLYGKYEVPFIQKHLSVENISEDDISILRLVTRRAKAYFENKAKMENRYAQALGDDSGLE